MLKVLFLHPALDSPAQETCWSEETTTMIKGLELLFCEDMLRELGVFSQEKRRLWWELVNIQKRLVGKEVAFHQGVQ